MAGPFDNDYLRVIPQDKRLDPRWVRSLYERDEPDVYRGWEELRDIGMPVGGLAGERDRLIDSSKLGT